MTIVTDVNDGLFTYSTKAEKHFKHVYIQQTRIEDWDGQAFARQANAPWAGTRWPGFEIRV